MNKEFKVSYKNKHYFVSAKDSVEAVSKVRKLRDNKFEEFLEHFDVFGVKFTEVPNDRDNGVAYQIRYKDYEIGQEIREKAIKQFGKHLISHSTGELVVGDSSIRDDRLSPMTYKKLKEYGYTPHQWQNMSQEQANKIIASRQNKSNPKKVEKKEEKGSKNKTKVEAKSESKKGEEVNKSGSAAKSFDGMSNEQLIEYFSGPEGDKLYNKMERELGKIEKELRKSDDAHERENADELCGYELQDRILSLAGQGRDDYSADSTYGASLLELFENPSMLEDLDQKELDFFKAGLKYFGIERKNLSPAQQRASSNAHKMSKEKESLETTDNVEILEKYVNSEDKLDRERIAGNKNTPQEILEKLSKDKSVDVREKVACNPNISLKTMERLSRDEYFAVRDKLSQNKNLPKDLRKSLKQFESKIDKLQEAASNSKTPPELLDEILNSKYVGVTAKWDVAENPNTSVETLKKLSNSKDGYLREYVTRNPKVPVEILRKLSRDEYENVRESAKEALEKRKI